MGKFARNYKDVEQREGGYDGEEPKPGVYPMDLVKVEEHDTSDTATHWVFQINDGPFAGWQGHVYTNAEGAAWKEAQILTSVGLLDVANGKISTTHEAIVKKAGPCRARVINETYEDERRGKIRKIMPPGETDAGDDSGGTKAKKGKKGKKAADSDGEDPF